MADLSEQIKEEGIIFSTICLLRLTYTKIESEKQEKINGLIDNYKLKYGVPFNNDQYLFLPQGGIMRNF